MVKLSLRAPQPSRAARLAGRKVLNNVIVVLAEPTKGCRPCSLSHGVAWCHMVSLGVARCLFLLDRAVRFSDVAKRFSRFLWC